MYVLELEGRLQEFRRLADSVDFEWLPIGHGGAQYPSALQRGWAAMLNGDRAAAAAESVSARAIVEALPDTGPRAYHRERLLAEVQLLAGDEAAAIRSTERALRLMPPSRDAWIGADQIEAATIVLAWAGERNRAVALLEHSLELPFGVRPLEVLCRAKLDLPVAGHAGFEALRSKLRREIAARPGQGA